MRSSILIFVGFCAAACAPQPASPNRAAACTSKSRTKYDGASAKGIEERLRQESARLAWDTVPEQYRAWAAQHLELKLSAAAVTLAASANCKEVEAAASKIPGLGKRIAEVAKQCTEEQCVAKQSQASEIERTLDAAICPLFPFC